MKTKIVRTNKTVLPKNQNEKQEQKLMVKNDEKQKTPTEIRIETIFPIIKFCVTSVAVLIAMFILEQHPDLAWFVEAIIINFLRK